MNKSAIKLMSAWRNVSLMKPPYIMPGDEITDQYHEYESFEDYINDPDFAKASPTKFHGGLVPIPYSGDILKAKIYILSLNPGFGPHDYYAESYDTGFRNARIQELRQQGINKSFPFMGLNPLFSWHGGYSYWTNRLGDMIDKISIQKNISYKSALSLLSQSMACLEYIPYHSKSFGISRSTIDKMRSPKLIKAFVDDYVMPKAIKGDAFIIVTRRVNLWLSEEQQKIGNVITYSPVESRAAYLNSNSPGGRVIAKAMKIEL